jgi:DNA-binding PadR family transcriptional regulator
MVLDDAFDKLESDLRRSVIVLATLSQLRTAKYGYSLRQTLSEQGMEIEEGTLRRYYMLSTEGRRLYPRLVKAWRVLTGVMDDLIEEGRTK